MLRHFLTFHCSGQSSSGSPQNNSDKENQLYEIKETVNIAKEDEKEESTHKEGAKGKLAKLCLGNRHGKMTVQV